MQRVKDEDMTQAQKRRDMILRQKEKSAVEKANRETRSQRSHRYNSFKEEFGDIFETMYDLKADQSGKKEDQSDQN